MLLTCNSYTILHVFIDHLTLKVHYLPTVELSSLVAVKKIPSSVSVIFLLTVQISQDQSFPFED